MGIDPISTFSEQPIEFLPKIFESGVGYSARSALSSVLIMDNRISFGKHLLIQRFSKGIFNLRPSLPRQIGVRNDPDIVLDYLSNLKYDLPLKDLSEKLVILLCLLLGQRDQTVKALNIKNMVLERSKCTFFIKKPMKTTKPGFHQSPIAFSEYPSNGKICIVTTFTHGLGITKTYKSMISLLLTARHHIRQSPQAQLAGGAKSYLGKQELILKKTHHTQLDQPPQVRQNFRDYHWVK